MISLVSARLLEAPGRWNWRMRVTAFQAFWGDWLAREATSRGSSRRLRE